MLQNYERPFRRCRDHRSIGRWLLLIAMLMLANSAFCADPTQPITAVLHYTPTDGKTYSATVHRFLSSAEFPVPVSPSAQWIIGINPDRANKTVTVTIVDTSKLSLATKDSVPGPTTIFRATFALVFDQSLTILETSGFTLRVNLVAK